LSLVCVIDCPLVCLLICLLVCPLVRLLVWPLIWPLVYPLSIFCRALGGEGKEREEGVINIKCDGHTLCMLALLVVPVYYLSDQCGLGWQVISYIINIFIFREWLNNYCELQYSTCSEGLILVTGFIWNFKLLWISLQVDLLLNILITFTCCV
jgi:hypothetical protein